LLTRKGIDEDFVQIFRQRKEQSSSNSGSVEFGMPADKAGPGWTRNRRVHRPSTTGMLSSDDEQAIETYPRYDDNSPTAMFQCCRSQGSSPVIIERRNKAAAMIVIGHHFE